MTVREYTCRDCGIHVTVLGNLDLIKAANEQDICVECMWLRAIEDPAEREKLRAFLSRREP